MRREGSQVLVATHSPLLVTLPGASLLELDEAGFRTVEGSENLRVGSNNGAHSSRNPTATSDTC